MMIHAILIALLLSRWMRIVVVRFTCIAQPSRRTKLVITTAGHRIAGCIEKMWSSSQARLDLTAGWRYKTGRGAIALPRRRTKIAVYLARQVQAMKDVPITEAKNALTALVHEAEAGKPVRLTRRGKPVAVLMSEETYRRLQSGQGERGDLWEFVESWRAGLPRDWQGLSTEEVRRWRDSSPGRDFEW
jgi:prevent-host-death family protein